MDTPPANTSTSRITAFVGRCEEAPQALAEAPEPLAIVGAEIDTEGAAQLFAHVRGQARLLQLPIFGVVPRREDLAFTELFSWGGDDLLALASAPSFARRLRPLIAHPPNRERRQTSPEHCAIVGGADARWRSIMGRALYQGGFSVRFVASADDLHRESLAASVALLVLADDLGPGQVEAALRAARAHGSQVAWIVVTPPKGMAVLHAATKCLGTVSVLDGFAPPENVLFVANEILSARGVDQRGSPRLLYGTSGRVPRGRPRRGRDRLLVQRERDRRVRADARAARAARRGVARDVAAALGAPGAPRRGRRVAQAVRAARWSHGAGGLRRADQGRALG